MMDWVWLAVLVVIYFYPAINALDRKHHNTAAIFALNTLFGWTLVGWGVALVWSYTRRAPQNSL